MTESKELEKRIDTSLIKSIEKFGKKYSKPTVLEILLNLLPGGTIAWMHKMHKGYHEAIKIYDALGEKDSENYRKLKYRSDPITKLMSYT